MKFKKFDMPAKSGNGTGLFFKLADGESKRGIVRGEIYEFFSRWVGGKSFVVPMGEDGAKPKFRVNIITEVDGVLNSQIWEFGIMIYQQLAEIAEDVDITTIKLKIKRHGTGTDTTYVVLPAAGDEAKISPKQMAAIDAVPLKILEHKPEVVEERAEGF